MRFMSLTTGRLSLLLIAAFSLTSCGDVGKFEPGALFGGGNKKWETVVAEAQAMQDRKGAKPEEVEKLYKEAIEICKKKYGENSGQTGTAVGYLAGFYMTRQDWKLAYSEYRNWKAIMQEVDPAGEQMKQIDADLRKIKEKLIQYNMVPDEVLKKRAEKKAEEEKKKAEDASKGK